MAPDFDLKTSLSESEELAPTGDGKGYVQG